MRTLKGWLTGGTLAAILICGSTVARAGIIFGTGAADTSQPCVTKADAGIIFGKSNDGIIFGKSSDGIIFGKDGIIFGKDGIIFGVAGIIFGDKDNTEDCGSK